VLTGDPFDIVRAQYLVDSGYALRQRQLPRLDATCFRLGQAASRSGERQLKLFFVHDHRRIPVICWSPRSFGRAIADPIIFSAL
jgi:hypothetical protein